MSSIHPLSKPAINWPALMAQYEQSQLNRKQFCKENNISVPQFKYHHQKLKQPALPAHPAALVPITLKTRLPEDKPMDYFQLIFSNDIRCQIPAYFNSDSLKQLIEVLQAC